MLQVITNLLSSGLMLACASFIVATKLPLESFDTDNVSMKRNRNTFRPIVVFFILLLESPNPISI